VAYSGALPAYINDLCPATDIGGDSNLIFGSWMAKGSVVALSTVGLPVPPIRAELCFKK